uniref:phytochrome A-associated F-box protein n=1 Tax=Erigeron canadensis TaxID=72917 RepID=UPI001CB8DB97|nr:phytochrome A-associated F-box protein [Erigeron canadensis]
MSETEKLYENMFTYLSDDVILNIFLKLVDDPRSWSRLACVSTKFSTLIRTTCWKNKCQQSIPAVVSDLNSSGDPPGCWSSLYKLAVCCPGLVHSGVLLENSDLGLERELGPDENYQENKLFQIGTCSSSSITYHNNNNDIDIDDMVKIDRAECSWSLYDDLYLDTVYNDVSKNHEQIGEVCDDEDVKNENESDIDVVKASCDFSVCKKRKNCRSINAHLASEGWNFSREQGNKLLASRFRGDCLYICDWPGCVHSEEKRNYMLFRGVFKNFNKSRVWRTIKDGNRSKMDLHCAFCPSNDVWDLQSAFCLRPAYGYHDNGEPVVRAYVCENGHVSGAWTDWPLYT